MPRIANPRRSKRARISPDSRRRDGIGLDHHERALEVGHKDSLYGNGGAEA